MTNDTAPPITATRRTLLGGALGVLFLPELARAQSDAPVGEKPHVRFNKRTINGDSDFECACAADIDGDGRLDIVSGDTWYRAPDWTPHPFREIGVWGRGPNESGYRNDFADIPLDVNGDGRVDIVSCDYASGEIFWHENPGAGMGTWKKHSIAKPGSMETMALVPLLGRRTPAILPNCGGRLVWYELRSRGATPEWVEHIAGAQGAGHGVGWGDVDGDGKLDLLTPSGWHRQLDARADRWEWRPDWQCKPGAVGIGMPVSDFDGDGRPEVVFGAGHDYGLFWLRPTATGWEQRPIDITWSQAHTLMLVDLFGDRRPGVLTGKRYKAHDTDPGANEPLGVYYYQFDRRAGRWRKYVIDEGTHTGTGLQMTVADVRGIGRSDVIAPGKSGLYLFENERS